jgi:hypothetical protein
MAGVSVGAMQRVGFAGFSSFGGMTAADGKFTIGGLTPGDYVIRANLMSGQNDQATALVTIDGSDVTDLQLTVTKLSTLRGRVVFEPGGTPPQTSAIRITALRTDPMVGPGTGAGSVKDDLTFEMPLAPGRIFVRSPPTGPNWRLGRVLMNGTDVTDSGIEVPVSGSLDVVVELTDHLYPISGKVNDANGALVRDCFVIVFGQDANRWTPGTRYLAAVRPGLDDLYHAKMPAGDYYAVAMTEVEAGSWTDPEFLSLAREHATRFTLAAGDTKTVDLPLSPAPVY